MGHADNFVFTIVIHLSFRLSVPVTWWSCMWTPAFQGPLMIVPFLTRHHCQRWDEMMSEMSIIISNSVIIIEIMWEWEQNYDVTVMVFSVFVWKACKRMNIQIGKKILTTQIICGKIAQIFAEMMPMRISNSLPMMVLINVSYNLWNMAKTHSS